MKFNMLLTSSFDSFLDVQLNDSCKREKNIFFTENNNELILDLTRNDLSRIKNGLELTGDPYF